MLGIAAPPSLAQTITPVPTPRPVRERPPAVTAVQPPAMRDGRPTLPLSLADAVFIGLRKNTTIRSAYIDRIAQLFDLKVAEDIFTPKLRVDAQVLRQSAAGETTDSVIVTPSVTALTPIGTQFNFMWDSGATRSGELRTRADVLTASITQPLLRGAGYEVNMASVKAARLSETNNRLALRATVAQTITDVISAYRTLTTSIESLKLAEDSVLRAQALIDVNKTLIEAGRMADVEIVQAEADLENQRLSVLQGQGQVDAARLALATLLDIDLTTNIVLRDSLTVKRTIVTVTDALNIALRARPDYVTRINNIELARLGVVVAENQRLWDLSIVGTSVLSRNTQVTTDVPALTTKTTDLALGMRLGIPLNDLAPQQGYIRATTSLKSAELQLDIAKRAVEQQIRQSVTSLDLQWRQLEAARRVVTLAASAVDIEKQKLSAGRSSNFQVQSLEASFRSARLQSLSAEINYLNSLTLFDLQLGTTLDTWKVTLRDTEANVGGVR
ncbi:MAG: TolC family protein [Pseudolabrys sp.]|nr:TolC family protein [Pseudolabrys sp.]